MFEWILGLLIFLCCLVGFNVYLHLKNTNDDNIEEEEILSEITEELLQQKSFLQNQKDDISQLALGLSKFNYPLKQLTRYLSGGTLAGKFGEWGLEAIITDIIPSNKIKPNHEIKKGSGERVEFAIDLDEGLLPIDAKFPSALYDTYVEAAEKQDKNAKKEVDAALKAIKRSTKGNAKDINEKYMLKGVTIDFGVMFIPSESLMLLIDRLQEKNIERSTKETIFRDYRVLIMGPNSFAAFLISINMGFKSIALNERAEEILQKFGILEKEFRLFEGKTDELRNKAQDTVDAIDIVERRVRVMNKAIEEMEELSEDKD
ncbi:uncharacterized protein METZ01_LOCUS236805 [marine metagenome]|uniref:DNA recombination protein RmuC n=1 Tax=marine metagenome TaxID=408172 RepID=A0A382HBW0_9ZZZZ